MADGATLESQIEELLDQETFEPPAEFAENAVVTDDAAYEQAAEDPEAFWAEQAEQLPELLVERRAVRHLASPPVRLSSLNPSVP